MNVNPFRKLGRRVERFVSDAERAAEDSTAYRCGECDARFDEAHERCPECDSGDVAPVDRRA